MKTFLMIAGAVVAMLVIVLAILIYLFVGWANRPENVAALKKERETEAAQKAQDERERDDLEKDLPAKLANLKLVIDENFANERFDYLDYQVGSSSQLKFKDGKFNYYVFSTRNSNPVNHFIFSKEDFGDFAAEMDFNIHGFDARAGIFWDAQPNANPNYDPASYQAAFDAASGGDIQAGSDSTSYNLGSLFEAETTQKLRVERIGRKLKVSVNDKVVFDKFVKDAGQGKVGILLRNRGGSKDDSTSIDVDVKTFKVWK